MPMRRGVFAAVAVATVLAAAAGARAAAGQDPATAPTIAAVTPSAPRAGEPLAIDVASPARGPVQVCLMPGVGHYRCVMAPLATAGIHRATFTAPYPGRWTIVADAGSGADPVRRTLRVRPHADRLVVLAAGDSLVDNLSHGLAGRLHLRRDVVLRRDVQIGRGLSKPDGFDWIAEAQATVARWQPDVVVLFLGGNEGYDLGTVHCCGPDYVERFAALQRRLIRTYARDGRTRVYWTTLPAPAPSLAARRVVWAAENQALALATAEDEARLFDAEGLLTPGYRWRRHMRWHGHWRAVRDDDGIHLSRTGGRVAASVLLSQLRQDAIDIPERATRPGSGRNVNRLTRTRP